MNTKNTYISLGEHCLVVVERPNGTTYKFLFDSEHLPNVSKYSWHLKKASTPDKFYAVSKTTGKSVYLHQVVTGFKFKLVDHVDRDTFDNRGLNLRESNKSLNRANSHITYRSMPRGVIPTPKGKFQARVIKDGKIYHLGTYPTKELAHEAYKKKHTELFNTHSIYYRGN